MTSTQNICKNCKNVTNDQTTAKIKMPAKARWQFYWVNFVLIDFFFWFLFRLCWRKNLAIAITTTTSSASTDAAPRNTVGLDKKQSPRYQQPLVTDNLPTDENKPIAASLVKDQHDSDTDNNELEERDSVAIDLIDKTVATIIPVPPNDLMKLPNETRITHNIGAITIHTTNTLQRNTTTVSRDQLNSRAVIKSSSPSTMANNNTTSQKQHKPDAPMLNYIFDSHLANKHRHYDPRYV